MKKYFKLLFVFLCMFSLVTVVNAETGTYAWKKKTYCFHKNGTYARTMNVVDTTCSGNYGGSVVKTINGQTAYCTQNGITMSYGKTCSVAKYNQFGWMNGRWTEHNAVLMGYTMQYINSQNYSSASKYVYIVNAANNVLRFKGAAPKRTLHSNIQNAIEYGKQKAAQYKQVTTTTPVVANYANTTLTNVNNSYAKGIINVSLVNGSYDANMTVTATCNNCKIYTDSALTQVYNGTTLKAGAKQNLALYVKTNGYASNADVSVVFDAKYASITYPIAKVWNCGTGKQALITLDKTTYQIPGASVTATAKVPAKRICQVYNGQYYSKSGAIVSYETYKSECLNVCKIVDGKYYGKNGNEVSQSTYKDECLNVCSEVDGKYYGSNGNVITKDEYVLECLKPVCKIVDGKYYGKDGKVVDEATFKSDCQKICVISDGKYYGKNGGEVDKATYTKECLKPVCKVIDGIYYGKTGVEVDSETYKNECEKICVVSDGKYYGSNGTVVTEETYKYECTKPVCGIRDGKYYGMNATEVSQAEYKRQCEPSVITDVPSTGTHTSALPVAVGSLLVFGGIGSIVFTKKKNNIHM